MEVEIGSSSGATHLLPEAEIVTLSMSPRDAQMTEETLDEGRAQKPDAP